MSASHATLVKDIAPAGVLRAALNFGNPVLVQRGDPGPHGTWGEPRGITVDLAREAARRLGLAVTFVPFDIASHVVQAAGRYVWDVAFLAVDPARRGEIHFTAPYVVIEGTYLVRSDAPLRAQADFDRPGQRIAVGQGAAYDLYLSRTLKAAQLVRAPTSAAAIDRFVADGLDAAAGVRQPLAAYAAAHPGFRVIDGRFTAIEQAMACPRGRTAGAAWLIDFVEDIKRSGLVAELLARHGQHDAAVAPLAS